MTIDLLTGSKVDILLGCGYPFASHVIVPKDRDDTIENKYGTGFHLIEAALLERKPIPPQEKLAKYVHAKDVPTLVHRAQFAYKHLVKWLGKNEYRINFNEAPKTARIVETAVGYNPETEEVRSMRSADEADHSYKDRLPGEIPMTVDLGVVAKGVLLVLDHKTGLPPETKSAQNMTLALGLLKLLSRKFPIKRVVVAIHHAPRDGGPTTVYPEEVSFDELRAHREAIRRKLAVVDDGYMRPGPWCKYCPAKTICPVEHAELLDVARQFLPGLMNKASAMVLASGNNAGLTRAERWGHVHQLMEVYDALRERVDGRLRQELAEIREGVRPDGVTVSFVKKAVERLSKGGLERQLGKLAAGREINRLRKLGGLEVTTQLEMRKERVE